MGASLPEPLTQRYGNKVLWRVHETLRGFPTHLHGQEAHTPTGKETLSKTAILDTSARWQPKSHQQCFSMGKV